MIISEQFIYILAFICFAIICWIIFLFVKRSAHRGAAQHGSSVNSTQVPLGQGGNCPICLDDVTCKTMTNCGHMYCADCILNCWQFRFVTRPVVCPYCRDTVVFLHDTFSRHDHRESSKELANRILDYNNRFSGQGRSFRQVFSDLPIMVSWMVDEILNGRGLMYICNFRIAVGFFIAITYAICPLDAIPESAFGMMGILDDIIFFIVFAIYATNIFRQRMANANER